MGRTPVVDIVRERVYNVGHGFPLLSARASSTSSIGTDDIMFSRVNGSSMAAHLTCD